jgi:SAM-dependent methyltransferase
MRESKNKIFYDEDYFEGRTRQSPPHTRELIYPLAERTAQFLCRRCQPVRILDIGCAKGYLVEAFQSQGVGSVIGVDISRYAVLESEDKIRGRLIVADVQAGLPLHAASVDLVTALDLFEHVADPRPVLQEIRRVLTDAGIAYLKICHPCHPNALRDPTHINVQPLTYWKQNFERQRFSWQRIYEAEFAEVQGVVGWFRALVRRWREWAVIGTPADYKFVLWKRHHGR